MFAIVSGMNLDQNVTLCQSYDAVLYTVSLAVPEKNGSRARAHSI